MMQLQRFYESWKLVLCCLQLAPTAPPSPLPLLGDTGKSSSSSSRSSSGGGRMQPSSLPHGSGAA